MTTANGTTKRLVLWGDTQVGKTAFLATSLSHARERFPEIDWGRSADSLAENITPHWQRLSRNLWIESTSAIKEIQLSLTTGHQLIFVDVKGGAVRQESNADARQQLKDANAVLFLVEWNGQNMPRHFLAIDTAWPEVAQLTKGLVFTKCERNFQYEDPAWEAKPGWWSASDVIHPYAHILRRFPEDAIWPVSAYGYNTRTLRPAVILGEFGQMMPYQVNPRKVAEPLRWILDRL